MTLNPIAVAIPVFLAAIGAEVWVSRRRRLPAYRFVDAVTDLGCGVGNQAMALVFTPLLLAGYAALHAHASLVHFAPGSPWPWVIAFVGLDFVYYWWHRFSHEVNLLWAAHVVHHQSEDYNLAVALRQALFTGFTVIPFYWRARVRRGAGAAVCDQRGGEPALPVLDPHRGDRPAPRAARVAVQHALAPPGPPRDEPRVPRQELRGDPDRLGPALRHLRARARAVRVRDHQALRELRPGLGELRELGRARAARALPPRVGQAEGVLRAARLQPGDRRGRAAAVRRARAVREVRRACAFARD